MDGTGTRPSPSMGRNACGWWGCSLMPALTQMRKSQGTRAQEHVRRCTEQMDNCSVESQHSELARAIQVEEHYFCRKR